MATANNETVGVMQVITTIKQEAPNFTTSLYCCMLMLRDVSLTKDTKNGGLHDDEALYS